MSPSALDRGRAAFVGQRWAAAFEELSTADRESPLGPDDLDRLATAAILVGRDQDGAEVLARAYHEHLRSDPPAAARSAIWLGIQLLLRGEMALGGGWLARARDVLESCGRECAEQGLLLIPDGLQCLARGDTTGASAAFIEAAAIGGRFHDPDLVTLGRLGMAQTMVRDGSPTEDAAALLDEVMVAVTGGDVSPVVGGIASCAVIEATMELFDLRRAQEYTAALARWCAAQPDLVPFRGQCLVHQSQIMTLHGAWADAIEAAQVACERLVETGRPAAGGAYYQRGELHRLRGEFAAAEACYRRARRWMQDPQPGPALVLLARGHLVAASSAIRRAIQNTNDHVDRSPLLGAAVEISLAGGDIGAARVAADALGQIADHVGGTWLRASGQQVDGAVLVAEGTPQAGMDSLREAWSGWQELDTPYDAARVRVLMATAYRDLDDDHAAEMELDAARWIFTELGAWPDLARVDALLGTGDLRTPGGLTAREIQVLRLVATGRTNRAVAEELFLSEKTIARHISNIFTKVGVTSRSGATAYAYEHGLLPRD